MHTKVLGRGRHGHAAGWLCSSRQQAARAGQGGRVMGARRRAGSRDSKGAVHKLVQPGSIGSTSDSVKARCKCPCLIVRPAVRPGSRASPRAAPVLLPSCYYTAGLLSEWVRNLHAQQ
jgi:hypothetical protein